MNNRSTWTILAFAIAVSAQAQISTINGMKITPRVFNDVPTSTFTSTNNFPFLVEMHDIGVNTGTGWANRHIARFSSDLGLNEFVHPGGNDPFEITCDATVTSSVPASNPRRIEAGMLLNIPIDGGWVSDAQMILTNDGEVAAFGDPMPFYSFTNAGSSYTLGSKVRIGMRYFKDTDGRFKWQWHFNGVWSPKLTLRGSLDGLPYDFRTLGFHNYTFNNEAKETKIGFYMQVVNPNPDAKFTLENFQVDPYPAVKGSATLSELPSTSTNETLTIEVRNPGTTTVLQTATAHTQVNGHYAFLPTVSAGTYDIAIKGETHLRKIVPNVTITAAGAENVDVTLANGDVDNDNLVGLFDYLVLSDSFDLAVGDAGFVPGADLDRDGVISLFDYLILSDNFDKEGQL